jgi:uracil-DNA glycosylase
VHDEDADRAFRKPLVVGQAPSRSHPAGAPAFSGKGSSARRLEISAGVPPGTLLEHFDTVNLIDFYPGKVGKGDRFEREVAERSAALLVVRRWPVVLLAGKNVARAFGVRADYFRWAALVNGGRVAVIPHPSGVNRWWNCPRNRAKAARFLRAVLARCAPGSSDTSPRSREPGRPSARSRGRGGRR